MREPTPRDVLYAWHSKVVLGTNKAERREHTVFMGEPQCGWYRRRFVTGAPWVPGRIWCRQEIDPETGELTEPEEIIVEVDGQRRRDVAEQWESLCSGPITEVAFNELVRQRAGNPRMLATLKPFRDEGFDMQPPRPR